MTVELLQILALISFGIAGVAFLITAALFFLLDIPKLYGEISGRTAKKAIQSIQRHNEAEDSLEKSGIEKRKVTDKITPDENLRRPADRPALNHGAEELPEPFFDMGQVNAAAAPFAVPKRSKTTVLPENAPSHGKTTLLAQTEDVPAQQGEKSSPLRVIVEIGFAESDEIIE